MVVNLDDWRSFEGNRDLTIETPIGSGSGSGILI